MEIMKNLILDTVEKLKFPGLSGIVVSVDEAPSTDSFGQAIYYYKDDKGNLPQQVTYKMDNGKLVEISTYDPYEIGDQFP